MDHDLYKSLLEEGTISEDSYNKVFKRNAERLFSLHWEIRSVLYLGIILLTTGLGILIYENIDSIGHIAVLIFIALISVGCFAYCFKNKLPFSPGKVKSPNSFFDYILLLACLSFVIFVGYLQFQYQVFGDNYSLATLVPTLVLFFTAYYFDHLGILNMGIASFAVWLGVSVTPKQLLLHTDFDSQTIIYTYLLLGVLLSAAAFSTNHFNFKRHFKFSYQHYGVHITFITMLAGYFHHFDSISAALWVLGVLILAGLVYMDAMKSRSFYFLLLAVLYSYIAVSALVIRVSVSQNAEGIELLMLYFIISGAGLLFLLINLNNKMKTT